jgi:hypothetical protein
MTRTPRTAEHYRAAPRYPDAWRNALMASHEMTIRAEMFYKGSYVGSFGVGSGAVSCDRQSSIRRTANFSVDPTVYDNEAMAERLNPYGTHIKMWRGIRYPGGLIEESPIFSGRLDTVDSGKDGVNLRCSDMAAYIVDGRFYDPWPVNRTRKVTEEARAIILDAMPSAQPVPNVIFDPPLDADTTLVAPSSSFETERTDALDQLVTQLTAEWYADVNGDFRISKLPGIIASNATPDWIIDSGDAGVLVERVTTIDRASIFNGAKVTGEAVGGETGAPGAYQASQVDDPELYWGGPFGKVPQFYSGQTLRTKAAADALAVQLVVQSLSQVHSLSVTCIANAKLNLASVVRVYDRRAAINDMYWIQSMEIPLGPGEPMTMVLNRGYAVTASGQLAPAMPRLPEGARWSPWRLPEST